MKNPIMGLVATALSILLAHTLLASRVVALRPSAGEEHPPLVLRVGFVANESETQERLTVNYKRFQHLEELCEEMHAHDVSFPLIHFRIASGGYNDVYHWAKHGLIDLGIFSPGVFAAIQRDTCPLSKQSTSWERLGTEDRADGTGTYFYRSSCVVPAASPIHSGKDLVDAIKNKSRKMEVLFADPLSLSGFLAPMHALAQPGLSLDWRDLEPRSVFVFSHDRPLRLMASRKGQSMVAFVREQEEYTDYPDGKERRRKVGECPELFRVIDDFPELNRLYLSHAAIAVRTDLPREQKRAVAQILGLVAHGPQSWLTMGPTASAPKGAGPDAVVVTDETIRNWLTDPIYQRPESEDVSLRELSFLLQDYQQNPSDGRPLRIALCLSGGGAKCAYQVGAVSAIENKLREMRADLLSRGRAAQAAAMDIGLVVGTSGGAVNAVPVAMGLTRPADVQPVTRPTTATVASAATRSIGFDSRQMLLVDTWAALKKWQIVQLWSSTEWVLSVWTAAFVVWLIFLGCVVVNSRRLKRGASSQPRLPRRFPRRTCVLMVAAIAFGATGGFKGKYDVPAWLWFGPTFWYKAAGMLLVLGLIVVMIHHLHFRRGVHRFDTWVDDRNLAFGALILQVVLSIVLVLTTTEVTPSLLTSEGIEKELADGYGKITRELVHEDGADFRLESGMTVGSQLEQISSRILDPRAPLVRNRDLVLTVSNVRRGPDVPMNFYAYVSAQGQSPAPGLNWIDLSRHRGELLDFVIGSGSIFPMFPARQVDTQTQKLELIDGGFAHNSPIEAAVLWNATHIIQIEASPEEEHPSGSLLTNAGVAYNQLFSQAQDSDARAKDAARAIVFRIRPSRTINLVDFDHDRVLGAARRGFIDAAGRVPLNFDPGSLLGGYRPPLRGFRREPTMPDFVDVKLPSPAKVPTTMGK